MSKVPEVTLAFWVIKIAATTLGETGGDAVSMSMDLGWGPCCFSGCCWPRCWCGIAPLAPWRWLR